MLEEHLVLQSFKEAVRMPSVWCKSMAHTLKDFWEPHLESVMCFLICAACAQHTTNTCKLEACDPPH